MKLLVATAVAVVIFYSYATSFEFVSSGIIIQKGLFTADLVNHEQPNLAGFITSIQFHPSLPNRITSPALNPAMRSRRHYTDKPEDKQRHIVTIRLDLKTAKEELSRKKKNLNTKIIEAEYRCRVTESFYKQAQIGDKIKLSIYFWNGLQKSLTIKNSVFIPEEQFFYPLPR